MPASATLLATSALAVAGGAALGALLRWALAVWLNDASPAMPMGTLAANLFGGYAIGVAVGFFTALPELSPTWRLFVITGVLGGLTTFSSFSAEVVQQLQQGRLGWAGLTVVAHLAGSLLATAAGLATVQLWRG